jgi:hypothetical protein
VAPLRLGGLRGKKSTPSVWLGGTGELPAVGKQERQGERTRRGAQDVFRSQREATVCILHSSRVDCLVILLGDCDASYVTCGFSRFGSLSYATAISF